MKGFRGSILTLRGDKLLFIEDGCILVDDCGKIQSISDYSHASIDEGIDLIDLSGKLILPGFVDTHLHFPQSLITARWSGNLLDWLENVTFKEEERFSGTDIDFIKSSANLFIDQLVSNGTTTALTFGVVYKHATEVLLETAFERGYPLIAGKVLMDINAPLSLLEKPEQAYDAYKDLAGRWRDHGRQDIALTPRFALSCSKSLLEVCKTIAQEDKTLIIQTHLSESYDEINMVKKLFNDAIDYLDVYDRYGLIRKGTVLAHCLHLTQREWDRIREAGSGIAHCPLSNLFLGSGLFNLSKARELGISVGIGSDIGAGVRFSLPSSIEASYYVSKLQGYNPVVKEMLSMLTIDGAGILGKEKEIGSLEEGKYADMIVIDPLLDNYFNECWKRLDSIEDKLFLFLMNGQQAVISETYIAGKLAFSK
jgi:guanine deaminase